jgi:negative regulator of sigma E activity
MSEQIREQVSAFLDGELPDSETELLLKRLTRDGELRESFGRYALIGESIRGTSRGLLTKGFAGRVNMAIDGRRTDDGAEHHSGAGSGRFAADASRAQQLLHRTPNLARCARGDAAGAAGQLCAGP